MKGSEAYNNSKAVTPSESLEGFKRAVNFESWPVKERQMIPGFSPKTSVGLSIRARDLQREILLPVAAFAVSRKYFYTQADTRSAVALTVIVGQHSAQEAAEALVLQLISTQMRNSPRANLNAPPFGDVTVYRHPDPKQSIAFLRNNVGISIENYSAGSKPPALEQIASEIDQTLLASKSVPTLDDHENAPKISRFEPQSKEVHPGDRTDLEIEVAGSYEPFQYLFQAELGSYNLDPSPNDRWYFRAGPVKGKAALTLTVVNEINLAAVRQIFITIT